MAEKEVTGADIFCAKCGEVKCDHTPLQRAHYEDIAKEMRDRGKFVIPEQYIKLLWSIIQTGFWPALYDADGNCL